jgi:hypothetical protein
MLKKLLIIIFAAITLILVIGLSPNDEKPTVKLELSEKNIPFVITDYSWGNAFIKEENSRDNDYDIGNNLNGIETFAGDYVNIHFSIKPDNLEIIEHTSNKKSYIYEQFGKKDDGYAFQIDSHNGTRIFEIKGLWKNNQYISYVIKVIIK